MKINPAAAKHIARIPPPIPYERYTPPTDLNKSDIVTFKLRTVPNQANSQTFEIEVEIFRSGTVEQFLYWWQNLNHVLTGQSAQVAAQRHAMARRVLDGDALAALNNAATAHGDETNPHFLLTIHDLATHVFPNPTRALRNQKRYMRRYLRKKRDVKARSFVARVQEMNGRLAWFPPMFNIGQCMAEDEILDILEHAIPSSWQNAMTLQGFNPQDHTVDEFVEFCERLEFTEDVYEQAHSGKSDKKKNGTKSNSNPSDGAPTGQKSGAKSTDGGNKKRKFERGNSSKCCDLHETFGHSTSECKIVQQQVQKMKAQWQAQKGATGGKKWVRPAKPAADLHAMVAEAVEGALKKERAATAAKRKQEEADLDAFVADIDNMSIGSREA